MLSWNRAERWQQLTGIRISSCFAMVDAFLCININHHAFKALKLKQTERSASRKNGKVIIFLLSWLTAISLQTWELSRFLMTVS